MSGSWHASLPSGKHLNVPSCWSKRGVGSDPIAQFIAWNSWSDEKARIDSLMYKYNPQAPDVQQVNICHSVPLLFGRHLRSPGSNPHSSNVFGSGGPWICRFELATSATGLPPARLASIAMPIVAASSSCCALEAGASCCSSADEANCCGAAVEDGCCAPAAAVEG